MKRIGVVIVLLLWSHCVLADETVAYEDYFTDATLRIDYFHSGDSSEEFITIDQMYRQPKWAGAGGGLIDELNYGRYCVKVYDVASNRLIYSRGFCCIFGEYKTTDPARKGVKGTYHQSALIPFPKRDVLFVLERRDRLNVSHPLFVRKIDPASADIIKKSPDEREKVFIALKTGKPGEKVDLVFVAEGYTEREYDKFTKDVERFTDVLFAAEPFKSHKYDFNVAGVFRASAERGVDEPTKGLFRNTAVSASYNALDLPRYLLVDDEKAMRDIAGRVPYDAIIVMANTARYGGGGIYNSYCIFTADNSRSESIFLHEFGHSFANLADEYYSAAVAYDEFFPRGVEPLESNITSLLDPENIKWKDLLSPGIEVPTPWGQEEIESLRRRKEDGAGKIKARIEKLNAKGRSADRLDRLRKRLAEAGSKIDEEIKQVKAEYREKYKDKIGAFEGAGYTAKGLYRSQIKVGFFSNSQYNPVSRRAVERVIGHYID